MDVEEFKKKYEQLKDNPMYKNFCSILDTKNQVLERISKENLELKKQLEEHNLAIENLAYWKGKNESKMKINRLRRENQELKEQLEVGKEQYHDLVEEKENLQEQLSSNTLQFENQQKSFIEWLENMIGKEKDDLNAVMELLKLSEEDLKCNGIYKFCESFIIKLEEILSKYKEIVGGKEWDKD